MPRPAATGPTEVELQILRILWDLGPSPVREIHERLNADKGTNYSTTVKMLAVMLQKGLVKRDEKSQPFVYAVDQRLTCKVAQQVLADEIGRVVGVRRRPRQCFPGRRRHAKEPSEENRDDRNRRFRKGRADGGQDAADCPFGKIQSLSQPFDGIGK